MKVNLQINEHTTLYYVSNTMKGKDVFKENAGVSCYYLFFRYRNDYFTVEVSVDLILLHTYGKGKSALDFENKVREEALWNTIKVKCRDFKQFYEDGLKAKSVEKTKAKRRYNATYRLRKKNVVVDLSSKTIYTKDFDSLPVASNILKNEFGYEIQRIIL